MDECCVCECMCDCLLSVYDHHTHKLSHSVVVAIPGSSVTLAGVRNALVQTHTHVHANTHTLSHGHSLCCSLHPREVYHPGATPAHYAPLVQHPTGKAVFPIRIRTARGRSTPGASENRTKLSEKTEKPVFVCVCVCLLTTGIYVCAYKLIHTETHIYIYI